MSAPLGGMQLGVTMAGVTVGALVEMVIGFGSNLVWMALLPFFLPMTMVVAVLRPLALLGNVMILGTCWRAAKPSDAAPLALSVPFGLVAGSWAMMSIPAPAANAGLGALITWYAGSKLWAARQEAAHRARKEEERSKGAVVPQSPQKRPQKGGVSRAATHGFGFTTGCLLSSLGTGGPPLVVYATEAGWASSPMRFKASVQILFLLMNTATIGVYSWEGLLTPSTLMLSAVLIPALAVGMGLGVLVSRRVDKEIFQRITLIGLVVIGMFNLCKAGVVVGVQYQAQRSVTPLAT